MKGVPHASDIVAPSSGAITDLLAKLEAATGPDRELDAVIAWALGWRNPDRYTDGGATEYAFLCGHSHPPAKALIADRMGVPALTASLDASLALVERVLPGWTMACDATAPDLGIDWELFAPGVGGARITGTHSTHPVALLIALVKALIARDGAICASAPGNSGRTL